MPQPMCSSEPQESQNSQTALGDLLEALRSKSDLLEASTITRAVG